MNFSINDMTLAGRTTQRGVRLWEMQNLLGHVDRDDQGRRMFTPEHIRRAKVIAAAQMVGKTLAEIRTYVTMPTEKGHREFIREIGFTLDHLIAVRDELTETEVFDL